MDSIDLPVTDSHLDVPVIAAPTGRRDDPSWTRPSRKSFTNTHGKALGLIASILEWIGVDSSMISRTVYDECNDYGSLEYQVAHSTVAASAYVIKRWVTLDDTNTKDDNIVAQCGGYHALTLTLTSDARHLFTFHVSPRAVRFITSDSLRDGSFGDSSSVENMERQIKAHLSSLDRR